MAPCETYVGLNRITDLTDTYSPVLPDALDKTPLHSLRSITGRSVSVLKKVVPNNVSIFILLKDKC